ncbi:MAG: aspartate aminotransferase family protein [Actinomycetota bacterium]|jgi:acetylornithine/succinyldiaminopimelate/putrescine aminotransferase|nr:aspartate aminotransferase family protein [Actinomycetota bacterium]
MGFDLRALMDAHQGENFKLHRQYLNPQLARVLRTLGFDRFYERGEGAYLFDRDGTRYLDFLSGFGVFALGRGHPVVKRALQDALRLDLPNLVQLDCALLPGLLAKELVDRTHPGMQRCFFSNSGAESIECAIKFSKYATKRRRVLHADHSFHGLTNGALSLNGGKEFREGFGPLLPGADSVPFGDLDALESELRREDVAAFVVELIQGKGVFLAPEEYWAGVESLCRKHGTLFVADEVQTGLGRTGKLWSYEHYGLRPDMITISKALSGGYVPVGATLCSAEVFDAVYSKMERAVVHSTTFGRNQLAMVAGLATLQVLDDEGIVARAEASGRAFEKALAPLVERYELFKEVRGKGLMIGLVFGEPSSLRLKSRWKMMEGARKGLFSQLIVGPLFNRHRILTQVAADNVNVVKLLPPLIIGQEEIDSFTEALDDVLNDAHRNSSLVFEFGKTLAKSALHRDRA